MKITKKCLTSAKARLKYRKIPANRSLCYSHEGDARIYERKAVSPAAQPSALQAPARAVCEPRRGRRVRRMPGMPRGLRIQRTKGHLHRRARRARKRGLLGCQRMASNWRAAKGRSVFHITKVTLIVRSGLVLLSARC